MHHHSNRRARMLGALVGVVAIMAAGCSTTVPGDTAAGRTKVSDSSVAKTTPPDAVTPSAEVLPATLDLTAVNEQVTAERYVRIDTTMDANFGDVGSLGMSSTTTLDTTTGNLEVTGELKSDELANLGLDLSSFAARKIGDDVYLRMGGQSKWMKLSVDSLGAEAVPVPMTGQSILDGFESMGVTFTKAGTVEQDGETLTKYVGTFDVDDLMADMGEGAPMMGNLLTDDAGQSKVQAEATILITSAGAPRSVTFSADYTGGIASGSMSMTADYVEVTGTPDLSAPPASEVTEGLDFGSGMFDPGPDSPSSGGD